MGSWVPPGTGERKAARRDAPERPRLPPRRRRCYHWNACSSLERRPRCEVPLIELYNFLENNRAQIISALLTKIPKELPAYSRVARNDLKQSLEYLLEAYTDLLVTGEDESQRTYFKYLAKVRVSQSFKLGDVSHKLLMFLSVIRPMLQEKFRDHDGDGLSLFNKAMDQLEKTTFKSVATYIEVYADYLKGRKDEHAEYLDEENKQLGVDMSKFILFRG
jgi:hypothetical protein